MYRIFCESYQNFLNTFNEPSYRLEMSKPIGLLTNNEINKFFSKVSLLVLNIKTGIFRRKAMKILIVKYFHSIDWKNFKNNNNSHKKHI